MKFTTTATTSTTTASAFTSIGLLNLTFTLSFSAKTTEADVVTGLVAEFTIHLWYEAAVEAETTMNSTPSTSASAVDKILRNSVCFVSNRVVSVSDLGTRIDDGKSSS